MIRHVAISAAYGAGGGEVGSAVAERLGVTFVDRAIPMAVAERLEVEIRDPSLYHLTLESTALPFDTCVELILQAARTIGVPFDV